MLYCQDVELMLQDYLDGTLLASQREILEAHLRGCPECRALLAGIVRVDDRLDGLGEVDVPPHLTRAILDALPPEAYAPSPWRRALSVAAVPALVALVLVGGFLLKSRHVTRGAVAGREVSFSLSAPHAVSVAVVGEFNGWNPHRTEMVRASHAGLWQARLRLPPGVYQYAFVVDGTTWMKDPRSPTVGDGFGGENSVLLVDG